MWGWIPYPVPPGVALTSAIARWWSMTRPPRRRGRQLSATRTFRGYGLPGGAEALAVAREVDPDVVVLDLGLPGIDGLEVCRQLRTFSDAYVVMLTARDTEMDTIVGLSVGADDYITKPFSPRELVARIRAMLRRPRTAAVAMSPLAPVRRCHPPAVSGRCRSRWPAVRYSSTAIRSR